MLCRGFIDGDRAFRAEFLKLPLERVDPGGQVRPSGLVFQSVALASRVDSPQQDPRTEEDEDREPYVEDHVHAEASSHGSSGTARFY